MSLMTNRRWKILAHYVKYRAKREMKNPKSITMNDGHNGSDSGLQNKDEEV